MSVIEFSPQAWPKQDECIRLLSADSGKEVVGYGGAKGGGKSHLARTWQVMRRIKYKNSRGLLIRETYPELYHSQIDKLRRELPAELYEYADSKHEFRFTNGAVLEMGYIERAEDVYSRYWGAEYDDISIDECQNQDKKTFQLLKTCLRTTNPYIKVKMLLTFNWGGIGHAWLKKMFWRKWMKDNALESGIEDTWDNPQHWDDGENPALHAFVHAKVYDNPSITKNDPGYIERLKALPESLRKAYLDGDPDVFEGQFFTEFGTHLREKPFEIQESDLRDRLFFSLDSGTTHATSGGLWWISPKHLNKQFGYDYSLHRLFSYLAYGGTIDKHAREIFNRLESFPWSKGRFPDRLYYDPSMDTKQKLNEAMVRSAIDEYKDVFSGKPTVFIPANNDKVNGCQIMKLLFSGSNKYAPMRYWTGYNTSFEEGIASAVYDKNNKEIYQKRDGDDACFSGDTKIKTTDGDIEISKLVDKKVEVFTIDGVKKTNGSFITGMNRKIIKLTFSDGSIIKCTPDHLFLNKNKKWIKAVDFLDETSYIVDERRYDVCLLEKTVKHAKSSMGCDIIFVDIISKDHQKKRPGLKYYIGMYGNIISGKYLSGGMCIILMKMLEITKLIILEYYRHRNIFLCIQVNRKMLKKVEKVLKKPLLLRPFGMEVPKGKNGILNTTKKISEKICLSKLLRNVLFVVKNIKLYIPLEIIRDTVTKTAKPLRCVDVENVAYKETVYCLTVPDGGMFTLFNGAVVKNCDEGRYGMIAAWSFIGDQKVSRENADKYLEHNKRIEAMDWRDV